MTLPPIPIATFIIDPNYNFYILFNVTVSIAGLIIFNFGRYIDGIFNKNNIRLNHMNIIEILFRMTILVNIAFFIYQFFATGFIFDKTAYNCYLEAR